MSHTAFTGLILVTAITLGMTSPVSAGLDPRIGVNGIDEVERLSMPYGQEFTLWFTCNERELLTTDRLSLSRSDVERLNRAQELRMRGRDRESRHVWGLNSDQNITWYASNGLTGHGWQFTPRLPLGTHEIRVVATVRHGKHLDKTKTNLRRRIEITITNDVPRVSPYPAKIGEFKTFTEREDYEPIYFCEVSDTPRNETPEFVGHTKRLLRATIGVSKHEKKADRFALVVIREVERTDLAGNTSTTVHSTVAFFRGERMVQDNSERLNLTKHAPRISSLSITHSTLLRLDKQQNMGKIHLLSFYGGRGWLYSPRSIRTYEFDVTWTKVATRSGAVGVLRSLGDPR